MIEVVFACYLSGNEMLDLSRFSADQKFFNQNQYCPGLINPYLQACMFLQPQVKLSVRAEQPCFLPVTLLSTYPECGLCFCPAGSAAVQRQCCSDLH